MLSEAQPELERGLARLEYELVDPKHCALVVPGNNGLLILLKF